MGKSNTIEQQQQNNQQFNDYISEMNKNLDERKALLDQQLNEMEQKHYANLDKTLLIEGRYHHLTTINEWSLDSVNNIIDICSKAIFGSKEPQGSTKKELTGEVKDSIQAIKEQELYIANAAFDIIQSIVGSFKNSTQIGLEQSLQGKPIALGMTMFIGVENNTFSVSEFLKNESIVQTIFVFKVFYSIKEGLKQSKLSDIELYENQKIAFRNKIVELNKEISNLDVMDKDYESNLIKLSNSAELIYKRLNKLTKKIKKLVVDKIDKEQDYCDSIIENICDLKTNLKGTSKVYKIESTPFTYIGGRDNAIDYIQRWTPRYAHLRFLKSTDYSGNHFIAIFESENERVTQIDVNEWVAKGLGGKGNFRFD